MVVLLYLLIGNSDGNWWYCRLFMSLVVEVVEVLFPGNTVGGGGGGGFRESCGGGLVVVTLLSPL